ncbi:hypothetical protein NONO_c73330 [Nocardia nova SH22a]|uniref:Uncharacterized protein n=1 Tax=Nocardia nova SH22a TaxID=1415166 RepID=W5TSE8_9NOCA|nr:hypothetical protein [Nocardia nova]AHH22089.1 hypothetical protein NONO_c73330 [Nocardia nova SH22a]
MAVPELHYAGQSYQIEDSEAETLYETLSMIELGEQIGPRFIDIKLRSGSTLTVLLSPEIPLALKRPSDEPRKSKAAMVL